MELLISVPGASLSAGRQVSLLVALLLRGLTLAADPAGVCAPGTKVNWFSITDWLKSIFVDKLKLSFEGFFCCHFLFEFVSDYSLYKLHS
jgi:hypothetical protein